MQWIGKHLFKNIYYRDISNGRVRISENFLLHKSNKKIWQKLSDPTFSEIWNLNKNLQQLRKHLFKKIRWIPVKKQLMCIIIAPPLQLCGSHEDHQFTIMAKNKKQKTCIRSHQRGQKGWELIQSLFIRKLSLFEPSNVLWNTPLAKKSVFALTGAQRVQKAFSSERIWQKQSEIII